MKENIIIVSGPIARDVIDAMDRLATTGIGVIVVDIKETTFSAEPEKIPYKLNCYLPDIIYTSPINKKSYTKNAPRYKGKR